MNDNVLIVLGASAVLYGTPLLFGAMGELLTERSGIINLGVEGMMLIGAVSSFWIVQTLPGPGWLVLVAAVFIAGGAAGILALIHAFLSVTLRASQIVSGIALAIFGAGLAAYLGSVGAVGGRPPRFHFARLDLLGLSDAPIFGPIVFHQNALVYLSWILLIAIAVYLTRTRWGLRLKSVGESPATADSMGVNVTAYRYAHTVAGGFLAGIGGAFYSLVIALNWLQGLTAGAGWIAIALVIFSFWRPFPAMIGAYLFGGLSSLGFVLQAREVNLPPEVFSALPYLMTIVVLVIVSNGWARQRIGAPAALGEPYLREES
jgi:general nucleoside transport system permease protein